MGAGNMAEAMISGTVQSGKLSGDQIIVSNRSDQQKREQIKRLYGVRTMASEQLPFDEIDVLILAMKPKDIDTVLDLSSTRSTIRPSSCLYLQESLPATWSRIFLPVSP